MILLGISGKKQSGKDTCAEMIEEALAGDRFAYVRLAFADALYEEVAEFLIKQKTSILISEGARPVLACSIPRSLVEAKVAHIKANKPDYRLLLQWWGTDYRRKSDPDYWIKRWLAKFRELPDNSFVVVPDVRFLNEAECVEKMGGLLARVTRHASEDTHASEVELDDYKSFHYNVANTSTLEDLRLFMTSLTKQITIKYQ